MKGQHVAIIAIETKKWNQKKLKLALFKNTNKYNHWNSNMFKSHWACWALNFKHTCNKTFSESFSAAQDSESFCRLVSLLISGCISCSKYASSWLSKNSSSSISSSMKREENILFTFNWYFISPNILPKQFHNLHWILNCMIKIKRPVSFTSTGTLNR